MNKIFIVGCGYIGKRVARLGQDEGGVITALARSEGSAEKLANLGIKSVTGNLDDPGSLKNLPLGGSTCYYFAPPPIKGKTDPRIEAFLSSIVPSNLPERIVLISTSGVYGDCKNEWITEERPPIPQTDRAFRRLDAENRLRKWGRKYNVSVAILRVPGIYGPGKLPEERLRQGKPVLREADSVFSNRIHADDLARVCIAAALKGKPDSIYNVSDGNPTTMTDYFYRVADILNIPRPPAVSLDEAKRKLNPETLSYLMESRRMDNTKMREELGVEPLYPNLSSGLPACI